MKIIKLTDCITERPVYINLEYLVAFWAENDATSLTTTEISGRVKETPSEIIELITKAEELKGE